MHEINQCIAALESFDSIVDQAAFDYKMYAFVATEADDAADAAGGGRMAGFKAGAAKRWQQLKDLAHRIWEFIKSIPGRLAEVGGKILAAIKRAPDTVRTKANKAKINAALAWANAADKAESAIETMVKRIKTKKVDQADDSDVEYYVGVTDQLNSDHLNTQFNEGYAEVEQEVKVGPIKAALNKVVSRAKGIGDEITKVMGDVNAAIDRAATKPSEEDMADMNRRQKVLSTILRALAKAARFLMSIPSKVTGIFRLVFNSAKGKLENHEGPKPNEGDVELA